MEAESIQETTLRELIGTGVTLSVQAVGQHGGFAVVVCCEKTDRFLANTRRGIRLFPNLTTLAAFLRKIGVLQFSVDTANYEPGRVRAARPDRAEALRRTRTVPRQRNFFEEV